MNYFVIGYYALLIGASCLAAYYSVRSAFLLLFSLTLVSFIVGIIGGESALWTITICAGILATIQVVFMGLYALAWHEIF